MKILYLNCCKWLLFQNQQVRNDTFGYKRYEALVKYIKPFLKKTLKWKDVSARTISGKEEIIRQKEMIGKRLSKIIQQFLLIFCILKKEKDGRLISQKFHL